jgi:lycopene cyclase-like protein
MAAALAERQLNVVCVAPDPCAPWRQRFGGWHDRVQASLARDCVEAVYPQPLVHTDSDEPLVLPRAYAKIDTQALQAVLLEQCQHAGVRFMPATVTELRHLPDQTQFELANGRHLTARLVVDASGASSRFVERIDSRPAAFQSAYGELLRVRNSGFDDGRMQFMDFRPLAGADEPTFLYAMPLGRRLLFAEETSLVGRAVVDHHRLRVRLHRRLISKRIVVESVLDRERCVIPMGLAPPRRNQRVVAFGAAAAMVHPATGYQLMSCLLAAAPVAHAIADALANGSPSAAARAAYAALWPAQQLRSWELFGFGMEVICELNATRIRDFINAFFRLPDSSWRGFLDATLTPPQLVAAMLRVFGASSAPLRRSLLGMTTGNGSRSLVRAARPHNPL